MTFALQVPTSGEGGLWERYHVWLERATGLESVARTLPDKGRYLKHVAKCAIPQTNLHVHPQSKGMHMINCATCMADSLALTLHSPRTHLALTPALTLALTPALASTLARYAEGKARSKVGNAVRRGKAAHEYDDQLDDDAAHEPDREARQ